MLLEAVRKLGDTPAATLGLGFAVFWALTAWPGALFGRMVGRAILIVFLAQDGEAGANRFGANPKAPTSGRSMEAGARDKSWPAAPVKR